MGSNAQQTPDADILFLVFGYFRADCVTAITVTANSECRFHSDHDVITSISRVIELIVMMDTQYTPLKLRP
jgi:hypothetical protein